MRKTTFALGLGILLSACSITNETSIPEVQQWTTFEITLQSDSVYSNPYKDVEVWASFTDNAANVLNRPAFWDGGNKWKIRFTPIDDHSIWNWETVASDSTNVGLHGQTGSMQATPYTGDNTLLSHGLLKMSNGKRNVVHQDGSPFLLVADTPWSIPFRATKAQVKQYAVDRQQKGFNAALLMSLQPDKEARGPEARNTNQGFDRAFADLQEGHINLLKPDYFQYMDSIITILIAHEIVPVYQPVFHGFGWKGLDVLGNTIEPLEYVRYCKYLLARYGSQPACWLLAGDNGGKDPGVKESGEMMETWDCYAQPTGLHYNPCDDFIASWAVNNPLKHCMHYNKTWQEESWLDFQWAQSGHGGEHLYHKVERMYDNLPTKASANGEPTYEGMNDGKNGLAWWQGEEAWMQLMSGGTMGVVYGAASLWQWKISADEVGWSDWASQYKSWEEAMQMEGSTYVGYVGKALSKFDCTDIEKRPELTGNQHPLLAIPDRLYVSYINKGGNIQISDLPAGMPYRWFNPQTGEFLEEEITREDASFSTPNTEPWVLIIGEELG